MNHAIDVESLLQEVSSENPCGEDLEYDPDFLAMSQAAESKAEHQMGDSIVPAQEADWRTVKSKALDMFKRTQDIRIAVLLARALVVTDGLIGMHDGFNLVRGMIDRHWDGLHPQLDPEDDNDPTMRVNTLLNLCGQDSMIRPIREVELVNVKGLGRYTFRDYLVAVGELPAPPATEQAPPGLAEIEAAFTGCELEGLQEFADAVRQSLELVGSIESLLMEKVGASDAISFSPVVGPLKCRNSRIPNAGPGK